MVSGDPSPPLLSGRESRALRWRASALNPIGARKLKGRADKPDWVIVTDAAASTSIIAVADILIKRGGFATDASIGEVISAAVGKYRGALFDATGEIYGLEMTTTLGKLFHPHSELRGQNAAFRIDNRNALPPHRRHPRQKQRETYGNSPHAPPYLSPVTRPRDYPMVRTGPRGPEYSGTTDTECGHPLCSSQCR